MKRMRQRARIGVFLGLFTAVALAMTALGQPAGGDRGRGGREGGRGGDRRRRFDPAQMEARMMERIQERLGASDDEWKAIGPLVKDVSAKQRDLRGARGFMRRRRNEGEDQAPEAKSASDLLEEAVENNSSSEVIKTRLDAYRKEQAQKEEALEAAQEKLRGVLTVKQEASLVLMGMLD